MRIGIIGGGLTGLTTAYKLAKEGHDVSIFERGSNLGGLAGGFKLHGESIEKTYHHLFKTDTDIISFVEELGISDKLIWQDSSVAIFYENNIYPFSTPIDLLKFKPLNILQRIRLGLVTLYLQKTKNWENLENITALAWMKKFAGKRIVKVIWEPLLLGKFHQFYDKVSMAWLWARIHVRGNSRNKTGTGEKLGYFKGGFQVIIDTLEKKLADLNVKINLNSEITEIISGDQTKLIIAGKEEIFDKILFTGPSHVFAHLIKNNEVENDYLEKLNSIDYLGAVVGVFSSKQKIGDFYWYNINDTSKPFLVFINHTNLIDKSVYSGNYVYYIGRYFPHDHKYFAQEDSEIYEEWFATLKTIFPDFNSQEIIEKHLFKFKNAQHIVDTNYSAKIPEYITPLKNIYLANFSQIYPEDRGTNYAVREGNKIAKIIIK